MTIILERPFPDLPSTRVKTTFPADRVKLGAGGKPLGVAPAAVVQKGQRPPFIDVASPVERIVDLIARFLWLEGTEEQWNATGRAHLTRIVQRYVDCREMIEIAFPAFPFKSPSGKKVLGNLPDFGEELLLKRLNALAATVADYHEPGAVIRIVSDGVVYGEILGQSDETVYRYNAELRRMVAEFSLTYITFVRVSDLLNPDPSAITHEDTEEEYIRSISSIRAQFLAHEVPGLNIEEAIKNDYGTLMTYRGYLKFLTLDLEGSPLMEDAEGRPLSRNGRDRARRAIAKQMLINGAKFSDLVRRKFPRCVRISCHAHDNAGPKLAFNLFPGHGMAASSWHNVVYERADASLGIGHLDSLDPSRYETVYRYGRPYYLREITGQYDLGERINPHVAFIRNFPFGLLIVADPSAGITFAELPMDKIRALAIRHSALVLRGFGPADRDTFLKKSHELGEVVMWPQYGAILELKEDPNFDINSSLTCEAMPMHYDGIFKTKRTPEGTLTHDPPRFQAFQCIHSPDAGLGEGGQTLLTNTNDLMQLGLTEAQRKWLEDKTFSIFTPANKVFGGDHLKLPLVMKNDGTGHDVLRWHENWPQWITKYKPTENFINDVSIEESNAVADHLVDLMYDRRFCYAHTWTTGEFLIADNIELLHTRTAFKPCPRELWRIHIN